MEPLVMKQQLRTRVVAGFLGLMFLASCALLLAPMGPTIPAKVAQWGVPLLLLACTMLFARIEARVVEMDGGRGIDISYGGGVIHQRFTPNDIESASVVHYRALQMGGWGYRGSLRFFRYAALATQRGDALQLNLTRNRRFILTVDNAAAFVQALQ